MEVNEPMLIVNEIFGYRRIVWSIKNYFSGTCGNDWHICSPVFCVYSPFLTKWRLGLKASENNCSPVSIYLERIKHDPFPERVMVNWKFLFPGEMAFERASTFAAEAVAGIFMHQFCDIEYRILHETCFNLTLECHIIVYREDDLNDFDFYATGCMKSLSQDMSILSITGTGYDAEFYNGSADTIRVHRAILCYRNHVFKEMIPAGRTVVDLNLPCEEVDAVRKIISFLYTGNLKYILRTPSFSIEKAIHHFDVEELKMYYTYDELQLETVFPVYEAHFETIMKDLHGGMEGPVSSDDIRVLTDDKVLRVVLYPRGIGGAENCISLQIQILEEEHPRAFCIYIGIVDINEKIQNVRCARRFPADERFITVRDFASRDILDDPHYVCGGEMKLSFKMRTAAGDVVSEPVPNRYPAINRVDKNHHYIKFSRKMGSLLKHASKPANREYSDLEINGIRVHRMIISSRSYILAGIIGGRPSVLLEDIKKEILKNILYYMYTGVMRTNIQDEIMTIYTLASELGIQALRNACSRWLLFYLDTRNAIVILIRADSCKDRRLKREALGFIRENLDRIRTQEAWRVLINYYPALHRNFLLQRPDRIEVDD